jgi:uncharacterized Fe-S cluster-containing radical SAM superfamily protein
MTQMTNAGMAGRFQDPAVTATGAPRAVVPLSRPSTLWFNTGTLCNITCQGCYIGSSPTNDALVYLGADEVAGFLTEAFERGWPLDEVGFTGGEPFLNPEMIAMAEIALARGLRVLVLTNAMRPMQRPHVQEGLRRLHAAWPGRMTLRVSLDHHSAARHDALRGAGGFEATLEGMRWLRDAGLRMTVAGRTLWGEPESAARARYAELYDAEGFAIDAGPAGTVLFPEMDQAMPVPEITDACWGILGKRPDEVMCATSRMVVRRNGSERARVVACTLLPYDPRFDLGATLAEAERPVALNHPHCARFCVLGGASCSG